MSQRIGDIALQNVIDEMRIGRHPAPQWEVDKQYWVIRTIEMYMTPSHQLRTEAWVEFNALKKDAPAQPYQRRESVAVAGH